MPTLTLSALIGTWTCLSPGQPDTQFTYVFARNGALSISANYHPHTLIVNRFRYSVSGGYLMVRDSNNQLMRDEAILHGRTLEVSDGPYWHEGHWTASSSGYQYRCERRTHP